MLAESTDPAVRGMRDLREITNIPALAAVPVLENALDRRNRVLLWGSYAAAVGVGVVTVIVTIISANGVSP